MLADDGVMKVIDLGEEATLVAWAAWTFADVQDELEVL